MKSITLCFSFFLCFHLICVAQTNETEYGILSEKNINNTTPLVEAYKTAIKETLKKSVPVLTQNPTTFGVNQAAVEAIVLADTRFLAYTTDSETKQNFRNEIFGIYLARPSDYANQANSPCSDGTCYRVEMYNFALNLGTSALVHLSSQRVLGSFQSPHSQPDIPKNLKEIALQIATESKEVQEALGFKPSMASALMADTKTSLNRSRCERSKHLCVAPTFVKGDKALWAIVDLTDLKLLGVRWTNVGKPQQIPTERRVQNEHITECFCEKMNSVEKNDWKLNYILTSSDGLRISEVEYKGKRVVNNAKLVDWHVSYSNTDGFGYSDAVGCPFFSTAAVVAVEQPTVKEIIENEQVVGFALEQSFYSEGWPTACNYNYKQRYEFYSDGRFRVAVASLGRGCGNNGTYRPVTRIAFAGKQSFSEWKGDSWEKWQQEKWQLQSATTALTPQNFQYQITDNQGVGYNIEANKGQMKDGGRGDNAYLYVTKNKPDADEGESDLITIGPCCNTDYHQGPEKFIEPNPDDINDTSLVLWYVAQLKNDDREGNKYCWAESFLENGTFTTKVYPCFSGAMFVPTK